MVKVIKILVVDDNPENIDMMMILLKSKNYDVISASNGQEALDKVRAEKFDLIISDILMPVMDGFQLCRECKKDTELCKIYFIFYTATYIDDKDEEFALSLGAQKFLRKPQEPEAFLSMIKEVLEKSGNKKNKPKIKTSQDEKEVLQLYSERLVAKLEKKNLDLENEIASHKKTGSKLKESEERYRTMIDNSHDLIQSVAPDGHILFVNPTWRKVIGYSQKEIAHLNLFDIIHPDSIPHCHSLFEKTMKGKAVPYFEVTFVTKNGKPVLLEGNAAPRLLDGKVIATQSFFHDVTERKLAEETIIKERTLLRTLLDNLPNGVFVKDKEYRKIIANTLHISSMASHLSKLGLDPDIDIIGKTDFEVTLKEDAEGYFSDDQKVIRDGQSIINKEEEGYGPDGKKIWLLISKIPLKDKNGDISGMIGITTDITEHKMATETIIKERTLLRTLLDNLPNGVFVKDKEYRKIIVNPVHIKEVKGHLKYLGMDAEINILGKTDFDVFPKELAEKFVADDLKVVCDGSAIPDDEGIGFDENGEQRWLLVSKMPLRNIKGEIIGMVGVTTDISDRRHAEEALKISEEKFRTIFNNASDGMFLLDTETRKFLMCNIACSKMLGYSDEEFLNLDVAAIHPSEALPFIFEQIENIFRGVEGVRGDIKFKRKNSTVFTADLSPTLVTIAEKRLVLIVFRDITERLLIETELRSAKEKAEESDKLKTAFLHNISHEIRTPLNGIIGFSDMVANPNLTAEKRELFSKIIRNSSDELLSIVNDIISMATIEAGHEKLREKEFNMNQILQLIKKQNLFKIESKNLTFTVSSALTDDESIVLADETKILQVLTNLVSNAIKFTPEGSIEITCKIDGNSIKFAIKDTGIGIPPKMHEKIFDRFFQLDHSDTRLYGGTGLGLSIVKSYVHLLNGTIQLNSKPGKGSEFIISIPYKPVKQFEPADKTVLSDNKLIGPATILIAEDEIINFELLEEFLSGLNLTIIHAANGLQAVEACKKNPSISLVLMDVKMPQMDGYEAARRIKEFRPQLPIIIQSAYIFQNEREKSMATYTDGFLEKPINQNVLLATIQKSLKKSANL